MLSISQDLTAAGSLYRRSIYRDLINKVGSQNVCILSAGWGLVYADDKIPTYNITFSNANKIPKEARITSAARTHFDSVRRIIGGDEDIHLFITAEYAPYWMSLFPGGGTRRVVLHWRQGQPTPAGWEGQTFLHNCGIRIRTLFLRRAQGLALPGLILLTAAGWSERVLRHELEHQRQMRRYSPLGAALLLGWHYGRGIVQALVQHGRLPSFSSLWHSCPLELAANAAMSRNDGDFAVVGPPSAAGVLIIQITQQKLANSEMLCIVIRKCSLKNS